MPMVPRVLYDAKELELLSREDRLCYTGHGVSGGCVGCPAVELCSWLCGHKPSEEE